MATKAFVFGVSCLLSLSYPLQCSCLENTRDQGDWWAAVHRIAQSRTRLKRLSSSSLSLLATPPVLLSHFQRICAFPFSSVFSKKKRDSSVLIGDWG